MRDRLGQLLTGLAVAGIVVATITLPAQAQEAFECMTEAGPTLLFKLKYNAPLSAIDIRMRFHEKTWTSADEGKYATAERDSGIEIQISNNQTYRSAYQIKFDVEEEYNRMDVVAEVRLFKAVEGGKAVYGGTLRMNGVGVWALRCEGAVGARL